MWSLNLNHVLLLVTSIGLVQQISSTEVFDSNIPKAVGCDNFVALLIERFRSVMLTGSEKLGIPKLAPYEIDYIPVDVTHEVGNAIGNFSNFKIEQLDSFETTNVKCKILKKFHVEINVTVPVVNITGDYNLNGYVIEIIPMFGNGPFSVNITNLHIGVIVNGTIIGFKKYRIQDLSLWVTMDKTEMYFHNLLNGDKEYEELFNKMFSEIGPIAVEDLWPDIEPILVRQILKAFNPEAV